MGPGLPADEWDDARGRRLAGRLERLTKRALVDWLVERARRDEAFRGELAGLAAPVGPPRNPERLVRRMLAAGRPADALDHLDRWRSADPSAADHPTLNDLHSEALLALGRPNEAFEVLWSAFRRTLRMGFLRDAMAVAPRGRAAHLDAEALDAAERHPDADLALGFLIARGALDRAAGLIDRRFEDLSESAGTGLQPVVAALREDDPRQAWQLLRLTLIDALEERGAEAGGLAAGCLRQMRQLAAGAGFAAEHAAFVEQFRQEHPDQAALLGITAGQ